jgi:hypothetical protein
MLKKDASQDSLRAIGGVERGKRSDELIKKRGLCSQKHCRRGRHLAALEAKDIPLLDRRETEMCQASCQGVTRRGGSAPNAALRPEVYDRTYCSGRVFIHASRKRRSVRLRTRLRLNLKKLWIHLEEKW